NHRPAPAGRWWRRYRIELRGALAVWLVQLIAAHVVGAGMAYLCVLAGLLAAWEVPTSRAWLSTRLVAARRGRAWSSALAAALPGAVAAVTVGPPDRYGERAWVRISPGSTVTALARASEALAACLGAAEVRVRRHPDHAGVAEVRALRVDPLSEDSGSWPWLDRPLPWSLWHPVPLGVDENGGVVSVQLPEHNLLLGGEPGSGKSVAISLLVAAAAASEDAALGLMDGKLVELAPWRGLAHGFAGTDIAEAIELLRRLQKVMDSRYARLLASGRRKVGRGEVLHVVVCDELAHYLTWPERKARDAFTDLLRDLVSRGRAAGMVVVAATQKPGSDVVPTSLRDLFGYRLALRCATSAASDTILGSGWATEGYSASSISPSTRGVGYLLHESGVPVRMRTYWADDATVAGLIDLAAEALIIEAEFVGWDPDCDGEEE
ncbi:MAG: FtsK/SpoIIIE domain-containing protein, partial [Acidimicrobiales bacterium]